MTEQIPSVETAETARRIRMIADMVENGHVLCAVIAVHVQNVERPAPGQPGGMIPAVFVINSAMMATADADAVINGVASVVERGFQFMWDRVSAPEAPVDPKKLS